MALQEQSAAKAAASLLMRPDLIIILRFFDGKVNSRRNICLRPGKKFARSRAGEGENARFSSKAGPLAVLSSITTVWDRFLQGGRLFGALSGLHIRRGGTVGRAWIVRFLSVRCAFRCNRSVFSFTAPAFRFDTWGRRGRRPLLPMRCRCRLGSKRFLVSPGRGRPPDVPWYQLPTRYNLPSHGITCRYAVLFG